MKHVWIMQNALVFYMFILTAAGVACSQECALVMGDSLASRCAYGAAIIDYKRYLFFNPDAQQTDEVYYRIATAYINEEKYPEALNALENAIASTRYDSTKYRYRITHSALLIASNRNAEAQQELTNVYYYTTSDKLKNKAMLFLAISYLNESRWEDAARILKEYFADSTSQLNVLDSLIIAAQHCHGKSPTLAKWLSTFLPGAGQCYAGNWKSGFNAVAVNSLTIYLLVSAVIQERYSEALITEAPLLYRYYKGNRHNAERIAKNYTMSITDSHKNAILLWLQKNIPTEN